MGHYNNASTPTRRGFDTFFGFYSGGVDYFSHVSQEACVNRSFFDDDDLSAPARPEARALADEADDADDLEHGETTGESGDRARHVYVKDVSTGYMWRCYRDLWDGDSPVEGEAGAHQTLLLNERAIALMERHDASSSQPFFAYVSYPNAHLPLQPPEDVFARHNATLSTIANKDRRAFAALMLNADESLANLTVRGLRATGLYERTVLIVCSDNGGLVSEMGGGSNYPLRGEKKYLFEGGVRSHGFIHSPLLPASRAGTRHAHLMHMSDWLPTILEGVLGCTKDELAGATLPSHVVNDYAQIDGLEHWSALTARPDSERAATAPRDELLLNIDYLDGGGDYLGYFKAALIVGDMKLIWNEKNISWFEPSSEYNFHVNSIKVSGRLTALYNISNDPEEIHDLKAQHPGTTKKMLTKIQSGYLPGMTQSNFRSADKGCYTIWDKINFVRPWVDDTLAEGETTRKAAALAAVSLPEARAAFENALFQNASKTPEPKALFSTESYQELSDMIQEMGRLEEIQAQTAADSATDASSNSLKKTGRR